MNLEMIDTDKYLKAYLYGVNIILILQIILIKKSQYGILNYLNLNFLRFFKNLQWTLECRQKLCDVSYENVLGKII